MNVSRFPKFNIYILRHPGSQNIHKHLKKTYTYIIRLSDNCYVLICKGN